MDKTQTGSNSRLTANEIKKELKSTLKPIISEVYFGLPMTFKIFIKVLLMGLKIPTTQRTCKNIVAPIHFLVSNKTIICSLFKNNNSIIGVTKKESQDIMVMVLLFSSIRLFLFLLK